MSSARSGSRNGSALLIRLAALLVGALLVAPAAADAGTSAGAAAGGVALTPVRVTIPEHIRAPRGGSPTFRSFSAPAGVVAFPGMASCLGGICFTPGEPVIAVGPSDVLQTVNAAATVYSKAGANRAEFDFSTFWGAGTEYCVDPRALYIASVARFVISCTDITTPTSPMRFAISATSDPAGAWYTYAAPNNSFLDQDKIEATSDKFIIAGNTGSTEQIYVYNLSEVVAGAAAPAVAALTAKKSNVYQAAVQQTAAASGYMVASFPGQPVYLATIKGTPAERNVTLTETSIAVKDFPAPKEPVAPLGSIGGGALDGRVYDAVYETETSDSKPVIAYSSARECGTRTCITSAKIDLSGAKPVLASYTLAGEPGWEYSYGAAGLDLSGTAYEVYARSSSSANPGVGVLGPGYDVTLQAAGAGASICAEGATPPCDIRWGDYTGTAVDPSEPSSVWVTGLYQTGLGAYGWSTTIAKVSAGSFALATATTGAASSVTATSATVAGTVNPNGHATSYHIDYGLTSGYEAATPEQSAGSGTSAVPVSVPLSGLAPGSTYHYRVVATTAAGNAVGADRTFKTKPPKITSVVFTGTPAEPTVTVNGSSFGTVPPANPPEPLSCVPGDTSFDYGTSLMFTDSTKGWTAGQTGDCIGLRVISYTSTKVVLQFGADYVKYGQVTAADAYKLTLWSLVRKGTVAYS
jgi:hypothetical protein